MPRAHSPRNITRTWAAASTNAAAHFFQIRLLRAAWLGVKDGGSDEEILAWAHQHGRKSSEEEIEVWNEFMRKRGWSDEASERLQSRLAEMGAADRNDIQTFFDFIDLDEGRK